MENVDWVPTLNLGYLQIKKENDEQAKPEEQLQFDDYSEIGEEMQGLVFTRSWQVLSNDESSSNCTLAKEEQTQPNFIKISVGTQTDDRYTCMSPDIMVSYQERVAYLEEMLCKNNIKFVKREI